MDEDLVSIVTGPVENGGLVEYFFGSDGKTCLKHDKFVQFLRDLHDEILKLEFAHYDYKLHGTISAKHFALSLVASADITHVCEILITDNVVDIIFHVFDANCDWNLSSDDFVQVQRSAPVQFKAPSLNSELIDGNLEVIYAGVQHRTERYA
ncbi:hypothetical protein DITRI_Ditri07aG0034900 [Diplodiscus trichospermus]